MPTYKLTLSYDGTDFSGWQQQCNAQSIHQITKEAIEQILQDPIRLIGSGRTDAGVHALAQVAHFTHPSVREPYRLLRGINALLPPTIRVMEVEIVDDAFHAQRSAKGKIYHYHLWLDEHIDPTQRLYVWKPKRTVDVALLRQAAKEFIGTKDFTSFANKANEGSAAKNPVRTIHRIDVVEETGGVRLEFHGNGFLYKMVRNIVGAMVAAASGKLEMDEIARIFAARDRRRAPQAAGASGLFLVQVLY